MQSGIPVPFPNRYAILVQPLQANGSRITNGSVAATPPRDNRTSAMRLRAVRAAVVALVRRLPGSVWPSCGGCCIRDRRAVVAPAQDKTRAAAHAGAQGVDGSSLEAHSQSQPQGERRAVDDQTSVTARVVWTDGPAVSAPTIPEGGHLFSAASTAALVARTVVPAPTDASMAALERVKIWLTHNPPDLSNSGSSLFRGTGDVCARAISEIVADQCRGAFEGLIDAAVNAACTEIESDPASRPSPGAEYVPLAIQIEQEKKLAVQLGLKFLGGHERENPMQQAVPPPLRGFLRDVHREVRNWSSESDHGRGSEKNVLSGALVLRGISSWATQKGMEIRDPQKRRLYFAASRMLQSLAGSRSYTFSCNQKSPSDPGTTTESRKNIELTAAVDTLKRPFQTSLDALIR